MPEVIAFPDGEKFLVGFLAERVAPARVGTKLPAKHTAADSFVKVSRSGGAVVDLVTDGGTYIVEVFGASSTEAAALAARVRAFALAAGRLSPRVRKATDGGGLAYLPDPDSGQPKYQCLIQLDMRGQALSF